MAGLDPAIHVFFLQDESKTWMRGSSPRMTEKISGHTDNY
jgi:hypothetical protein